MHHLWLVAAQARTMKPPAANRGTTGLWSRTRRQIVENKYGLKIQLKECYVGMLHVLAAVKTRSTSQCKPLRAGCVLLVDTGLVTRVSRRLHKCLVSAGKLVQGPQAYGTFSTEIFT